MDRGPAPQLANDLRGSAAAAESGRSSLAVALVTVPFVSIRRPSIQIGLLKAIAEQHGFQAETLHLNLDFARLIGAPLYEALCQHRGRMLGDWVFSLAAFGDEAPDPDDGLVQAFAPELESLLAEVGESAERLSRLRRVDVPRYLDDLLATESWERFDVVGFTSTFQQTAAAFSLARRIKSRHPRVVTVFGGANFEGEMGLELTAKVECVDYAVIGEGDEAFPELLRALAEGRDPAAVPGVVRRDGAGATPLRQRPLFTALDELPTPDYTEFFERAERLELLSVSGRRAVDLPFESARGCWWGQKRHCTFCGLNGQGMAFRAKGVDRLLGELAEMARRYRSFQLEAVDNILEVSYLRVLFPRLRAEGADYELFYETKSNLTREQLRDLRLGGVRRIQPGIESLSSHVLRLMQKGVTAIQNVNLLRWACYYGLSVGWNLIWGFPGERLEDHAEQLALMARIVHLQPPGGCGRIWMERFSPIFSDRKAFPAKALRPEASYSYVYPRSVDLDRVAYFFDYELEGTLDEQELHRRIREQVAAWQVLWAGPERPRLTFRSAPGFLQVDDERDPQSPGTYTFADGLARLYLECSERPRSAASLHRELRLADSAATIAAALDQFTELGLMMRDGDLFLSLALPATPWR